MTQDVAPLLEVEAVHASRAGRAVLSGVSLDVHAGEVVTLLGPNGAGKTTLLEIAVGARRPDRGRVLAHGRPLRTLADRSALLTWVADDAIPTPEARVSSLLRWAAQRGGTSQEVVDSICGPLHLEALSSARAGHLSRGERRRVALAEALLLRRPLVVLDEPFGTFDPLQILDVVQMVRALVARETALLVSVHQLEQATKIGDRHVLLHEGRVLGSGRLDELRAAAGLGDGTLEDVMISLLRAREATDAA